MDNIFNREFLLELLCFIRMVCFFVVNEKFSGLVSVLFFGEVIIRLIVLMVIGLFFVSLILLCVRWVRGVFRNVFRLFVVLIVCVLV